MMTVYDFVDYLVEPSFQSIFLYDILSSETIFVGMADEIPTEFENLEICSIDCIVKETDYITLNVELPLEE